MSPIVGAGEVHHAINASESGTSTAIAVRVELLLGQDITAGWIGRRRWLVGCFSLGSRESGVPQGSWRMGRCNMKAKGWRMFGVSSSRLYWYYDCHNTKQLRRERGVSQCHRMEKGS